MKTSQLVELVQAGDRMAFVELVNRYQRVATTRAWSVISDFHAAQDVAQDAFVIAFKKLDSLKDTASFGPWLLQICRREAIRFSKSKDDRTVSMESFDFLDTGEQQTNHENWQQKHAQAIAAIAKLPDHEQEVVVMHYLDGHSAKRTSEILGRPIGTITKQLSRAIKRLRAQLSEVHNEI